ncbi:hypothetical protein, variant 1 [Fonticula alba]|nr:hypothetical protein, variant 1 [Fonticula alba]KCV67392.1 hypothetical protein, variant 1 [Fonticula alba]|eukprot:XP_009498203.1 hypothetical protein, variant 1 [Fonticula alba]
MADIVGAGAGVSQAAALALDRVGAASGVPAALVLGAPPDPDTPFLLEVADLIRRYGALQQAIYGPLAALIARARACILDMQQEDALPDSDDEDPGHDSPEEDPSDEALKAGSSDGDLAAPAGLWPPLRQCDLLLATLVAEQAAARERLLRTVLLGHAAPGGDPIWVCLARFLLRRLGDHTEAALVPVPDRQATAWALKLSGMLSYSMNIVHGVAELAVGQVVGHAVSTALGPSPQGLPASVSLADWLGGPLSLWLEELLLFGDLPPASLTDAALFLSVIASEGGITSPYFTRVSCLSFRLAAHAWATFQDHFLDRILELSRRWPCASVRRALLDIAAAEVALGRLCHAPSATFEGLSSTSHADACRAMGFLRSAIPAAISPDTWCTLWFEACRRAAALCAVALGDSISHLMEVPVESARALMETHVRAVHLTWAVALLQPVFLPTDAGAPASAAALLLRSFRTGPFAQAPGTFRLDNALDPRSFQLTAMAVTTALVAAVDRPLQRAVIDAGWLWAREQSLSPNPGPGGAGAASAAPLPGLLAAKTPRPELGPAPMLLAGELLRHVEHGVRAGDPTATRHLGRLFLAASAPSALDEQAFSAFLSLALEALSPSVLGMAEADAPAAGPAGPGPGPVAAGVLGCASVDLPLPARIGAFSGRPQGDDNSDSDEDFWAEDHQSPVMLAVVERQLAEVALGGCPPPAPGPSVRPPGVPAAAGPARLAEHLLAAATRPTGGMMPDGGIDTLAGDFLRCPGLVEVLRDVVRRTVALAGGPVTLARAVRLTLAHTLAEVQAASSTSVSTCHRPLVTDVAFAEAQLASVQAFLAQSLLPPVRPRTPDFPGTTHFDHHLRGLIYGFQRSHGAPAPGSRPGRFGQGPVIPLSERALHSCHVMLHDARQSARVWERLAAMSPQWATSRPLVLSHRFWPGRVSRVDTTLPRPSAAGSMAPPMDYVDPFADSGSEEEEEDDLDELFAGEMLLCRPLREALEPIERAFFALAGQQRRLRWLGDHEQPIPAVAVTGGAVVRSPLPDAPVGESAAVVLRVEFEDRVLERVPLSFNDANIFGCFAEAEELSLEDLCERTRLARALVRSALASLAARGLVYERAVRGAPGPGSGGIFAPLERLDLLDAQTSH